MRRKQYVCCNCGEMFDEDELIAVYSLEGEGCMQGELFEDYKCPECKKMEIIETVDICPSCKWYDKEDDECLYEEPSLVDLVMIKHHVVEADLSLLRRECTK